MENLSSQHNPHLADSAYSAHRPEAPFMYFVPPLQGLATSDTAYIAIAVQGSYRHCQ